MKELIRQYLNNGISRRDLMRGLVGFARLMQLKLQRLQTRFRHQVRMRRNRAVGQQRLRRRFGTVFLGEGNAQAQAPLGEMGQEIGSQCVVIDKRLRTCR